MATLKRLHGRLGAPVLCAVLAAFALVRIVHAADGDLDVTFGNGGLVITDFGWPNDVATGLAVDRTGRVIVAGQTAVNGESHVAIARYTTGGVLDSAFGNNGKVTTSIGEQLIDSATDVAVDATGRIVVVGVTAILYPCGGLNCSGLDMFLARYLDDGTLDGTFGSGGIVITPLGNTSSAFPRRMAIDVNGKIAVAGYTISPSNRWAFTVFRYNTDGTLDSGFGAGGVVKTVIDQGSKAFALAVDANGKIVVAGWSSNGSGGDTDFALARYNTDGALDAAFGNGGVAIANIGFQEEAHAVTIDVSGRIIAAGLGQPSSAGPVSFITARFAADGTLDTTFNGTGFVDTDFGTTQAWGEGVRTSSNGKVLVAGTAYDSSIGVDFALVRYNTDGSLDSSFGTGGKVVTDFGGTDDRARALALESSGTALVAGYTTAQVSSDNWDSNFALARYTVAPLPPADVYVTASVDKPSTVNQGDLLTYTISVANLGPNTGKNVVVTDTLSGDTTFVNAQAGNGHVAGPPVGQSGAVTWTVGDVSSGSNTQAKLSVTVKVRGKTTVTNTATVTADSPDPNTANNTASITTKVGAGNRNK